jgi:hypothetical protein
VRRQPARAATVLEEGKSKKAKGKSEDEEKAAFINDD